MDGSLLPGLFWGRYSMISSTALSLLWGCLPTFMSHMALLVLQAWNGMHAIQGSDAAEIRWINSLILPNYPWRGFHFMEEFKKGLLLLKYFVWLRKKALAIKHPLLCEVTSQLLQWVLTLCPEIMWLSNFNAFFLFVLNFWLSLNTAVCNPQRKSHFEVSITAVHYRYAHRVLSCLP